MWLALLAAACGSDELNTSSASTTSTTRAPANTEPPAASEPECTDPAGDAAGGADLVKATLVVQDEMLTATYDLGGDVGPSPDGASWIIAATQGSGDNYESYQLGFKMAGDEVFRYVTDLGTGGKNEYVETAYIAEGRRVVASFPLSALKNLRGSFSWRAVTTFAGDDTDACPGDGKQLTFVL